MSVVAVWGLNPQLPAQQEHLCNVERNDKDTSKLVARQLNLLNPFPFFEEVHRAAKLHDKNLSLKLALLISMVSTNAFHSANLFLFSRHHSVAPFSA